jgi:hypothetical protein
VLLSRICGISDATLWQWRVGRTDFNVDLLSRYSDRFARALGLQLKLAEEAANLMSGIPWRGKKSGPQLLQYVVRHDLDAPSLLHLARRQERMNITEFVRKIGMGKDILSRISFPERYDTNPLLTRGNPQTTTVATRLGLSVPADIAAFRLLVTRGSAVPAITQEEIRMSFRRDATTLPRSRFLRRFFDLVRERNGLAGLGSLVDAVWEQTFPGRLKVSASMNVRTFKQRLINNTKPPAEATVHVPADWSNAIADFAFPGARELKLRFALARYLENASRKAGPPTNT